MIDQSIAPRMVGHVAGGTNEPQLVPAARQSSALFTTDGLTYPPPAAALVAGRPIAIWSGRSALCNWMQASAVMKFSLPWL